MRPLSALPLACLLWFTPVWAQDASTGEDAGLTDAGLPDGSVGEGGADREGEEAEDTTGRVPTACHSSRDCERGFRCDRNGRCVYSGVRDAQGPSCGGGGGAAVVFFLSVLGLAHRNGRPRKRQKA